MKPYILSIALLLIIITESSFIMPGECIQTRKLVTTRFKKGQNLFNDVFYFQNCSKDEINFNFSAPFATTNGGKQYLKLEFYRTVDGAEERFAVWESSQDWEGETNVSIGPIKFSTPQNGDKMRIRIYIIGCHNSCCVDGDPNKYNIGMRDPAKIFWD